MSTDFIRRLDVANTQFDIWVIKIESVRRVDNKGKAHDTHIYAYRITGFSGYFVTYTWEFENRLNSRSLDWANEDNYKSVLQDALTVLHDNGAREFKPSEAKDKEQSEGRAAEELVIHVSERLQNGEWHPDGGWFPTTFENVVVDITG